MTAPGTGWRGWMAALQGELRGFLDWWLPPACPLCGQVLSERPVPPACPACRTAISPIPSPRCPLCEEPFLTEGGSDHLCEVCLRQPPPFTWCRSLGCYEDLLRLAVQRFKYQEAVGLDRCLGTLLAERLRAAVTEFAPAVLVPVPLHRERLRQRTYNQSLLLARTLGRRWHRPVAARLLERTRATPSQQGLSAEERRRNLRGAFVVRQSLDGVRVLLIDDVLTTGATARECAATLLQAGAEAVAVAVLGRARRLR